MSVTTVVTAMMLTLNVLQVTSKKDGWTLDSEGICFIQKKSGPSVLSCQAAANLSSRLADNEDKVCDLSEAFIAQQSTISEMKDTVSVLTELVYALYNATQPLPYTTNPTDVTTAPEDVTTAPEDVTTAPDDVTTAPNDVTTSPNVQGSNVQVSISLTPNRQGGSQNCYDTVNGPCGLDLSVDGVHGLICFPENMSDDELQTLGKALLAAIGEPTTTLLYWFTEMGSVTPGSGYLYGWDYFDDPAGISAYWDLNDCVGVNSENLQDYSSCAKTTTFQDCSVTFSQRYLMMAKEPAEQ